MKTTSFRYFRFNQLGSGRWYIDFPEFLTNGGLMADLEMVAGADTLLSMLSAGENNVNVTFSTDYFVGADSLTLTYLGDTEGGAYYTCNSVKGIPYEFSVWLCDVTLLIFDVFPPVIYFH